MQKPWTIGREDEVLITTNLKCWTRWTNDDDAKTLSTSNRKQTLDYNKL
jgi:hypothetical protein